MTFTVSRGIEDALAPDPRPAVATEVLGSKDRTCGVQRDILEYSGHRLTLLCTKRPNHDDPYAEIGSVQTDPTHSCHENRHDGVTVVYSWPSERTRS